MRSQIEELTLALIAMRRTGILIPTPALNLDASARARAASGFKAHDLTWDESNPAGDDPRACYGCGRYAVDAEDARTFLTVTIEVADPESGPSADDIFDVDFCPPCFRANA